MARITATLALALFGSFASPVHAATGTIDYSCTSVSAQQGLDAATAQGHSALFYYRLRRAVEAGECKVVGSLPQAQSVAPANPPRAQAYSAPKPRVRTADRNGFPPPWLFKPLR